MCQLGHFINSENFKPRVELESGGLCTKRKLMLFLSPSSTNFSMFMGGGSMRFFFYPNVMDIRRNVTLNVIDSIAIIVCRKACVIRWQNVSHDTQQPLSNIGMLFHLTTLCGSKTDLSVLHTIGRMPDCFCSFRFFDQCSIFSAYILHWGEANGVN